MQREVLSQKLSVVLLIAAVTWLAASQRVLAEEAIVSTNDGGTITGRLLEYYESKHVVLAVGSGKTIRVNAEQISSIQVGNAPVRHCMLGATVNLAGGTKMTGRVIEYAFRQHITIGVGNGGGTRLENSEVDSVKIAGTTGPACKTESEATAQRDVGSSPAAHVATATQQRRASAAESAKPMSDAVTASNATTSIVTAGNNEAVVVLANGGRFFGKVLLDDPSTGVTVLLQDGTTRTVPRTELGHVEYTPAPQSTHLRAGFIAGGALLTAVGIAAAVVGIVVVSENGDGDDYSGAAILASGGVALAVGIPLFVMGFDPVPDETSNPVQTTTRASRRRYVALSPMVRRDGGGLFLSGAL